MVQGTVIQYAIPSPEKKIHEQIIFKLFMDDMLDNYNMSPSSEEKIF